MESNLNSKSTLDTEHLAALGTELALRQVQGLLLQQDLKQDRVAEPGSPAFAFGLTQGEMLLNSLRAAQLPIAA
jgi:hypothetical protein